MTYYDGLAQGAVAIRTTPVAKSRGRKPALSAEQKMQLPDLLARGPCYYGFREAFWTYERVGHVIAHEFGVTCSTTLVRQVLKQIAHPLPPLDRRTRYRLDAREHHYVSLRREWAQVFGVTVPGEM